jgi:hypothetical protein
VSTHADHAMSVMQVEGSSNQAISFSLFCQHSRFFRYLLCI